MTLAFGIDRLVADDFSPLHGKQVALFGNLNAVDAALVPTLDRLLAAPKVGLVALFGPEHGFSAGAADGEAVDSTVDARTGLPVYSLYGADYAPTPQMLDGLDLIVCDIQDLGVRYYTFLWSLTHLMEACGAAGVPLLILDRPNPLGGRVDGGPLDPALTSLVGRFSVPVQHSLTLGEMARTINARWNPTPARIDVLDVTGWHRSQTWAALGRAFVPPSPNMPHAVTALHYPGSCLLEGTTLSEGRGTPLPFEQVGAPGIDGHALADTLNALDLPGVRFRPTRFRPTSSKHRDAECGGVQAHITDAARFRPLVAWLYVIMAIRHHYPDTFGWLPPGTRPDGTPGLQHFDRLIGDTTTRAIIDSGGDLAPIFDAWADFQADFLRESQPFRTAHYDG